jgi:hypothetical protein
VGRLFSEVSEEKGMSEVVDSRTPELVVLVENPLLRHFLRLAQLTIEAKIPERYIYEAQLNWQCSTLDHSPF